MPITELRIEGLRTIEKVRLKLDGLTVLIGENGSGKSSIIEACEILRRARSQNFIDELYRIHGGLNALLRQGAPRLRIRVTVRQAPVSADVAHAIEPDTFEVLQYDLTLTPGSGLPLIEETFRGKLAKKAPRKAKGRKASRKQERTSGKGMPVWHDLLKRRGGQVAYPHDEGRESYDMDDRQTCLAQYGRGFAWGGSDDEAAQLIAFALDRIRVHLPFETMPAWAARALDRKSAMRNPSLFVPADHLEKLGANLANAYHTLKNSFDRDHWQQTLDYIRLGLGEPIEDITTSADPGGGHIGLAVKFRGLDRQIPAAQLSDGMLAYLALVAAFRLHLTRPSLLAFDEPDLHLHPHLLMRALDLFEGMARNCPILLATHSDRLLDGLSDPACSVVLCELDQAHATRLVRPDPEALARWLERYRGLGDLRAAGHAASVMTRVEPA